MSADIFDALNVNTKATGNWKKPPNFPVWPRPDVKAKAGETSTVSVADLFNRFTTGR